jgi:aspartate aminotransferase
LLQPVVIRSVKEAAQRIHDQQLNNEYAPIAGEPEFAKQAVALAFGADSPLIKENRIAAIQSVSGTGALRLIGAYLARFWQGPKPKVYLPNPTWGNHLPIFGDAGLETTYYKYYKPATKGLDLEGVLADIAAAPERQVFLFHACAHNPTGVDPSPEQWAQISAAIKAKGHFVILDSAYQVSHTTQNYA